MIAALARGRPFIVRAVLKNLPWDADTSTPFVALLAAQLFAQLSGKKISPNKFYSQAQTADVQRILVREWHSEEGGEKGDGHGFCLRRVHGNELERQVCLRRDRRASEVSYALREICVGNSVAAKHTVHSHAVVEVIA